MTETPEDEAKFGAYMRHHFGVGADTEESGPDTEGESVRTDDDAAVDRYVERTWPGRMKET